MSATTPEARAPRIQGIGRGLAWAALGLMICASAAEAKVIWDDPLLIPSPGRHSGCRSQPLIRAERLSRRQGFIVQRRTTPFLPYLFMPYPLAMPIFPTEWLWFDGAITSFARGCD